MLTEINYQYADQKSFSFDLPPTLHLRLDWNTKQILFSALRSYDFENDPKDMYHYSSIACGNFKILSFYLYMKHIEFIEEFSTQFDEIAEAYSFSTRIDEDGNAIFETNYDGIPEPAVDEDPVDPTV